VAIDPPEVVFRAHMAALAEKGGGATKRRYGTNPRYYRDIGRLGGSASAAARRARIAAELEAPNTDATPIVGSYTAPVEVAPPVPRAATTLRDVLADLEGEGPRAPDTSSRRQSLADLQAERDFTGWVARIRDEDTGDVESWDP
jgi:hypothetical protein